MPSGFCYYLPPQSTVGTIGASPQRKVAYFGGTDRHYFTKFGGIFNDNRN